jgi:predicted transcriptional regulator
MNVISFLDGKFDLLSIANKCNISYQQVHEIVKELHTVGLVEKFKNTSS